MSAVHAQPLSPELALVCPELRAQSLAGLPDIDLDALFRRPAKAPARVSSVAVAASPAPMLLAALAYAASGFVGSFLRGLVTVAAVAAVALVLTLAA